MDQHDDDQLDHVHHDARYHLDDLHDVDYYVSANDPARYGCTDDDCRLDHVHVIAAADLRAHYVDRPHYHEHPNIDRTGYHHDHHGRAVRHYHHADAVQYVSGDRLIPRPPRDHRPDDTPRDRID